MSEVIHYAGAKIVVIRNFLPINREVLTSLWKTHPDTRYMVRGHYTPRFLINTGEPYRFGGAIHKSEEIPHPLIAMTAVLLTEVEAKLAANSGHPELHPIPNNMLINWYATGKDSIAPHADNESLHTGVWTVVFGDAGWMSFRSKTPSVTFRDKSAKEKLFRVKLNHGDALYMFPGCQEVCTHEVAKSTPTYPREGIRVSITVRKVMFAEGSIEIPERYRMFKSKLFEGYANTLAKAILNEDNGKLEWCAGTMRDYAPRLGFPVAEGDLEKVDVEELESGFRAKWYNTPQVL